MAEGLGEGWDDKFRNVRDEIDKSLDFDDPSMSISASVRKIGVETSGMTYGVGRNGRIYGSGGITVVQNIQSVPMTPVELAATTKAYWQRARWAF